MYTGPRPAGVHNMKFAFFLAGSAPIGGLMFCLLTVLFGDQQPISSKSEIISRRAAIGYVALNCETAENTSCEQVPSKKNIHLADVRYQALA